MTHAPKIDFICYSRGGLVYRALAEEIFPRLSTPPSIGWVIFVACTLSGTMLAKAENWATFADFYTNLSAAAARAIAHLPSVSAKTVSAFVNGAIQGVGAFVKCLATAAVTEKLIPGLAAMDPDGDFVRRLNTGSSNQTAPAASLCAAISSTFEPAGVFDSGYSGIPKGFAARLLDGAVDQLLTEPNDLVVNITSMMPVNPRLGPFMKDHLDFGTNSDVYHTNYFLQPRTAEAMLRWLQRAPVERAAGAD
jgi:hypothetical protein